MGFVWPVPASSKEITGREQRGVVKAYHRWGVSKTVFEEGSYGMFFPSPEFSTPLCVL